MKTTLFAAALLVSSAAFAQSTTATDPMAGDAQTNQAAPSSSMGESPFGAAQRDLTMQPGQTTGAVGRATGSSGMATGMGAMDDALPPDGSPTQRGAAYPNGMAGERGAAGRTDMAGGQSGVGGPAQVEMQGEYPVCRSRTQDRCRQVTGERRSRR